VSLVASFAAGVVLWNAGGDAATPTPPQPKPILPGAIVFSNEAALTDLRKGVSLEGLIAQRRAFIVVNEDQVQIEASIGTQGHSRLRVKITAGPHQGNEGLIIP
jgi:hypothetical protein